MARAFGATVGVGASDAITTGLKTDVNPRSWHIWANRRSGASGSLINWSQTVSAGNLIQCYQNTANSTIEFDRNFGGQLGAFTCPIGSAGAWHTIGIAYDDSNTTNKPVMYLDGVSQSVTTSQAPVGTATNLAGASYIIGNNSGGSANFDGFLAEFAVWNNTLLTALEFMELALGAHPYTIRPASLAGHWSLDGYGHPALDRSIYANVGKLTGTKFVLGTPLISAAPPLLTTVNSGQAFLQRNPPIVVADLPKRGVLTASSVVFRKTLSQIGGRVGTRQASVGWFN